MTGSLSVRGEVMPIGGVSAKVEAAIETGIKSHCSKSKCSRHNY